MISEKIKQYIKCINRICKHTTYIHKKNRILQYKVNKSLPFTLYYSTQPDPMLNYILCEYKHYVMLNIIIFSIT